MGSSSTTTQKADPWGPAQPYILQGLQAAQNMWNSDPNQFVVAPWQGNAVAPEDPALQAANNAMGGFEYQQPQTTGPYTPIQPGVIPGGGGTTLPSIPGTTPLGVGLGLGPNTGGGFGSGPGRASATSRAPAPINAGWGQIGGQSSGGATPQSWPGQSNAAQQPGAKQAHAPKGGTGPTVRPPLQIPGRVLPDPNSFVEKQKGIAEQSQQGVNQIAQNATQNPLDPRFNEGINLGMDQTNDARFTSAINNMTGDGYDQQLRNQLRENVSASVMPGMNATFANSGMTGSGLHQQNLAKGLSAGMANAEAEFLNRAQDRQFQAGMAGQSALEAARARAMGAGSLAQQAGMDNQDQALRAYSLNNQMQQGAYNPYLQQQAVGEDRTRNAQQQLAADIMASQQAQAGPIDAVNNYLSLTSGLGGQFGSSTAKASQNPGLFGILGGLGQMLPFF